MNAADLVGRRVLVAGLGVTGRSVVRLLVRHGVAFEVAGAGAPVDALPAGTVRHADLDAAVPGASPGASATRDVPCHVPYDVIVLSPGIPRSHAAIRVALDAGTRVVGDIELFAGSVAAPVVAVTGSNGKSTVVAWLSEALVAAGVRAVPCGNIGDAALDAIAADVELYVLELSSYQLESTVSLAPLAAVVLNVSEDHLDRYDGFADYAATKRRIHAGADRRVVNVQDPETWPADGLQPDDIRIDAGATPGSAHGLAHDPAHDPAHDLGHGCQSWHLADASPDGPLQLCRDDRALLEAAALALPGRHNLFNALVVLALASVALSRLRGSDALPVALLDAVARFGGLPHRTELVAEIDGVRWYDDSKGTNVGACVRAIEAMPGPVVLIAGGLGKGADFTPLAHCAARLRGAVLIGRDATRLAAALVPAVAVHHAATLEEAVGSAATLAASGDAVLLSPACASFDMFDDFTARGRAFQHAVHALRKRPLAAGACR